MEDVVGYDACRTKVKEVLSIVLTMKSKSTVPVISEKSDIAITVRGRAYKDSILELGLTLPRLGGIVLYCIGW